MITRLSIAAILGLLALPAAAAAAEISATQECYREGTGIRLSGTGFTPGTRVELRLGDRPYGSADADGTGAIRAIGRAPRIPQRFRTLTLRAIDTQNPVENSPTTRITITELSVAVSPRTGDEADRTVTFRARGFTGAKRTLYVHYVTPGGRLKETRRLGRLDNRCGTLAARARLIPVPNATPGRWRLRFDTHRTYRSTTNPQVRLAVRVKAPTS